jgi:pyruvate-formate lyase
MLDTKASLCSQRALLYTESFGQTENEPYILRKAKAFAHTLDHMSIFIEADSLIFGNMASKNFAAPIFPEYSMDWLVDEIDTFSLRKGDVFQVDERSKPIFFQYLTFGWHIRIKMKSKKLNRGHSFGQ